FLFWSASANSPDTSAVLQVPNGSSQVVNAQGQCHSVSHLGGSYGCKADVTNFVRNNPAPGGSFNGVYTVRGVNGQTGLVDNNCQCLDPFCQAKYAGWSIVLVYSSASERTQRDIFLYDGYRVIDEELNSAGQDQFTISGFDVGSPPEARLSFFTLEGGRRLRIPPQDQPPGRAGCPNHARRHSVELSGNGP